MHDQYEAFFQRKVRKAQNYVAAAVAVVLMTLTTAGAAQPRELIPVGRAVGIKLFSDGVLVVGMNEPEGGNLPAFDAGIRTGDVITHIGADEVESIAEFREELATCLGTTFAAMTTRQKGNTYYRDYSLTQEAKDQYQKEYGYDGMEFLSAG